MGRSQNYIMIRLINIRKSNNVIECDFYPEDSLEVGSVKVDVITEQVVSFTLPLGYEYCRQHVNHAKINLIGMKDQSEFQESILVKWY